MTMWRVTVAPIENLDAWKTFEKQGVIGIGWPDHRWDDNHSVKQFKSIQVGDWVVAHVPASHGGGNCMALGVGKVVGPYEEITKSDLPNDDQWSGQFRRQYRVEWTLGERSLREVLNIYRPTVRELSDEQEEEILRLYGV